MKACYWFWITFLFTMIWWFTTAEVYEPKGYSETLELLDKFKYNITTLIFVDPSEIDNSLDQEQGEPEDDNSGFFDNLISSIKSVFSSDERSIGDLIKELSKEGVLIQVNVTNPNLAPVKEMYNIQSIPYIVILKGNKILYRDIATHKAAEKVANIKRLINEENKQKDKNETKQQSSYNDGILLNKLDLP